MIQDEMQYKYIIQFTPEASLKLMVQFLTKALFPIVTGNNLNTVLTTIQMAILMTVHRQTVHDF